MAFPEARTFTAKIPAAGLRIAYGLNSEARDNLRKPEPQRADRVWRDPCQGVSQSHSISSQDTRSVTPTKLNFPLPFMPVNGPVPPRRVTVPVAPLSLFFPSQRANNLCPSVVVKVFMQ